MTPIGLLAFQDNYIWVIPHEDHKTFTCIDPGDANPVLSFAKSTGLALTHILITHHHLDHRGGLHDLLTAFPASHAYAPHDQRIPQPYTIASHSPVHIEPYVFQVLSTPGHTATHVCYYEPHQQWLFCGDTLFSGGCGRVFDGTIEALHDSLLQLKNLPESTQVYCGHEYTRQNLRFAASIEPDNLDIRHYTSILANNPTPLSLPSTIGLEKKINPFFRTETHSVQTYAKNHGAASLNSLSIFQQLRDKKDVFV